MRRALRLSATEDYLFAFIDRARARADTHQAFGAEVIPLGVGDCDLPAPPHIVDAMRQAVTDPALHRYPPYEGTPQLRAAASGFLRRRYGLTADPASQVLVTLGSKEAMAHLALALLDPGDVVLVPDPAYPVYATWARFCGAEVVTMPLREENAFLPDLAAIPPSVARRAKLLWVCYPNNPTAALATTAFYADLAAFAHRYDITVASDAAYGELYYGAEPPPSFLQAPGAMERGVEFHSLSKTYNMPGWRIGFAVGDACVIDALRTVKTHTDSGTFGAVQQAAVAALEDTTGYPDHLRGVYRDRMRLLCDGLDAAGLDVLRPDATFYCLVRAPAGLTGEDFAEQLLTRARVLSIPGTGFGPGGQGFVRLTVCADTPLLAEAVRRIGAVNW
ncbi:aminotransferase class I/II-fold pyridoxal phosphate-dependent enzyme [Streptomyces chattanoogensis]